MCYFLHFRPNNNSISVWSICPIIFVITWLLLSFYWPACHKGRNQNMSNRGHNHHQMTMSFLWLMTRTNHSQFTCPSQTPMPAGGSSFVIEKEVQIFLPPLLHPQIWRLWYWPAAGHSLNKTTGRGRLM